jgi:hypothetical protein
LEKSGNSEKQCTNSSSSRVGLFDYNEDNRDAAAAATLGNVSLVPSASVVLPSISSLFIIDAPFFERIYSLE